MRRLPFPTVLATDIPGVSFYRRESVNAEGIYITRPCVSFLVQGAKQTFAGGLTATYREGSFLICASTMPGRCSVITPSKERPFLSIAMPLDLTELARIFSEIAGEPAAHAANRSVLTPPALVTGRQTPEMAGAVLRLIEAAAEPLRAKYIGPLIVKELHFLLALSPEGAALRPLCTARTAANRIALVVKEMEADIARDISPEEIARSIGMSSAVFHRRFRETTGLSPVQFQKRLRLFRAQELMVTEGRRVSEAAAAVGYRSASQFTREYAREFGATPRQDAEERRRQLASGGSAEDSI
ncbi:MAG: AraC family transcriptional regulator [Sutterella sp.]|nr:AraC family transcriptional regulator [Sutterella sp.]